MNYCKIDEITELKKQIKDMDMFIFSAERATRFHMLKNIKLKTFFVGEEEIELKGEVKEKVLEVLREELNRMENQLKDMLLEAVKED